MSTYQERRKRRAAPREEWARSSGGNAKASREGAKKLADSIPLGEPVLVGHHSEKRARKDRARIRRGFTKTAEHETVATKHRQAAHTIRTQLDQSVYDDDHDACQRLRGRIARREAQRERIKKVNTLGRKCAKAEGFKRVFVAYADTRDPERRVAGERAVAALIAECERRDLIDRKSRADILSSWIHGFL